VKVGSDGRVHLCCLHNTCVQLKSCDPGKYLGTVFVIASSEQRSNLQISEQVSGVGPIPIHPPDRSTRMRPVDQCFRDVLARNKREDKSNFSQAGFDERGSEEQMLRDWLLSDTESKPPDGL